MHTLEVMSALYILHGSRVKGKTVFFNWKIIKKGGYEKDVCAVKEKDKTE